eukprot:TRINITY_DN1109_c0_g1_i4.p1 TRINITY_DN1109_c0_g1~~TRINITY_DN1109_c0_g1_i4.p1  ORF type:complete len:1283 (+),score=446.50 TRINITY_DN1109_c0_g1_i4:106-3954(+)
MEDDRDQPLLKEGENLPPSKPGPRGILSGSESEFDGLVEEGYNLHRKTDQEKQEEERVREEIAVGIKEGTRDWQKEFLTLLTRPSPSPNDARERSDLILKLSKEFVTAATPIVKTIIRERSLDYEEKTIKPVIQGGAQRFVHGGFYLKFAETEDDQKRAGNDLRGLNCILSCHVDHILVPLRAVVNYHGFRVIVSSILPIGKSVPIYGPRSQVKELGLYKLLKGCSALLNLMPHTFFPVVGDKRLIHISVDMEGFRATNGNYYILHTARVMPPEAPSTNKDVKPIRLLRPEFVRRSKAPLSADTFTALRIKHQKDHNDIVSEATHDLVNVLIPTFGRDLVARHSLALLSGSQSSQKKIVHEPFQLEELHYQGIPYRYLGHLYDSIQDEKGANIKMDILTEIVNRSLYQKIQRKFRETDSPLDGIYITLLIETFNKIFGNSAENSEFWQEVASEISTRFPFPKGTPPVTIDSVNRVRLFKSLSKKLGLFWTEEIYTAVTAVPSCLNAAYTFQRSQIMSLQPTSKMTQIYKYSAMFHSMGHIHETEFSAKFHLSQMLRGSAANFLQRATAEFDMAEYYHYGGKYALAKLHYKNMLAVIEGAREPNHEDLAVVLVHLGNFFFTFGKYAKAETAWQQAMKIREIHKNSLDIAICLEKMAKLKVAQGKLAEAETICKKALEMYPKDGFAQHSDLSSYFNSLAQVQNEEKKYEESEKWMKRALETAEKSFGSSHSRVAQSLYELGKLYFKQQKYSEAEDCIRRSQIIREMTLGSSDPKVAQNMHLLAYIYALREDYDQAVKLYEKSLEILEKSFGSSHSRVAQSLYELGKLYFKQQKYSEAEDCIRRSQIIREMTLGSSDPKVAQNMHLLAYIYALREDYDQAVKLYEKSLEILEKSLPSAHPDVLHTRSRLMWLFIKQGISTRAEELHVRSTQIRGSALGKEFADPSRVLQELAEIYHRLGKYDSSEQFNARAMSIRENSVASSNTDIAEALNHLSNLNFSKGNFARALELSLRSLELTESELGERNVKTAQCLHNIAELYRRQGKLTQSEELFNRCLGIRESILGESHLEVAQSLHGLGYVYTSQGRYLEAEKLYRRALGILVEIFGKDHPSRGQVLNDLAWILFKKGEFKECETLYVEGLNIRETNFGPDHTEVARSLHEIAELYTVQGKFSVAEEYNQRALAIRKKNLGLTHPDVARSLNNLSNLSFVQGRYEQAEDLQHQSIAILKEQLGEEHPKLATGYHDLGKIYYRVGRYTEAEANYLRSLDLREKKFYDLPSRYCSEFA